MCDRRELGKCCFDVGVGRTGKHAAKSKTAGHEGEKREGDGEGGRETGPRGGTWPVDALSLSLR